MWLFVVFLRPSFLPFSKFSLPVNNQPDLDWFDGLASPFLASLPFHFRLLLVTLWYQPLPFLVYCWVFISHFWIVSFLNTTSSGWEIGRLGLCLLLQLWPFSFFMEFVCPITTFLGLLPCWFPSQVFEFPIWSSHFNFFF